MRSPATLLPALLVAVLATGCAPTRPYEPPPLPSEVAARQHLERVVELAIRGDLTGLCELGGGNCESDLERSNPQAVPRTAPIIVGIRPMPPKRRPNGLWEDGALVIELCGRDGLGRPYASEILVFESDGRLISIGTIFWTGARMANTPLTGNSAPAIACPADGGP